MPVISVTLIEGYDEATRERLALGLPPVAQKVVGTPAEGVCRNCHRPIMHGGKR